jgi:hypothetical protein
MTLKEAAHTLYHLLNPPGTWRCEVGEGIDAIYLFAESPDSEKELREKFPTWEGFKVEVLYAGKTFFLGGWPMGLIVLLLVLLLLTGGLGFGGFVALGSLALLVKVLFFLILVGLIISVFRTFFGGPMVPPSDPYI